MRIINLLKSCFFGDPDQTTTTNFLSFTLARPSTSHFLRITDRSWQHAFPRLWNQLPASLHQPRTSLSSSDLPSLMSGTSSIGSIDSPLSSSITLLLTIHSFIPGLKPSFSAYPSHHTFSLYNLPSRGFHGAPSVLIVAFVFFLGLCLPILLSISVFCYL